MVLAAAKYSGPEYRHGRLIVTLTSCCELSCHLWPSSIGRGRRRPLMREYRIASIPADGIGPEVISAGLEVLDAVAARDGGFSLAVDHYGWGSDWYRKHGV